MTWPGVSASSPPVANPSRSSCGTSGAPRPIIDLLHREIVKVLARPDVKARLAQLGFEPVGSSPDEFAVQIKEELEKWGKVVRTAKIKVE